MSEKATTAGRGVLYIAFAKFYFMVAGLVVVFRLPALLNHIPWGSYSTVNSLVSPGVPLSSTSVTLSKANAPQLEAV